MNSPVNANDMKHSTVIAKVTVIANAVKQSRTSNCLDCRATLAVTKSLFVVMLGIGPDSDRSP